MFKRPTPKETDEDLQRLQEEFLRQNKKSEPTAKKILNDSVKEDDKKKSPSPREVVPVNSEDVMLDIQERTFASVHLDPATAPSSPFPPVNKMTLLSNENTKPKVSLFAQHYRKKKSAQTSSPIETKVTINLTKTGPLHEEIDRENRQKLQNMTLEEIKEAQSEIFSKMDPNTVKFLRNYQSIKAKKTEKQKKVTFDKDVHELKTKEVTNLGDKESLEFDIKEMPISLDEVKSNKWVHMDNLERDKLQWTQPVSCTKNRSPNDLLEARFSFDGELMSDSVSQSIPTHVGLHHHGDDPDKAGYTLGELLTYLQSEFPSQRIMALNVVRRVSEKAYISNYTPALDSDVLCTQLLKFVLPARRCLDDSNESVSGAALATLRNLLYNDPIGEHALDRMFPVIGLEGNLLLTAPSWPEDPDALSDDQLIFSDVIRTIVTRTCLIQRIIYLASLYKNSNRIDLLANVINLSSDILVRICRHSTTLVDMVLENKPLIDFLTSLVGSSQQILQHLISDPTNAQERYNLAKILKVLRLIAGIRPNGIFKSTHKDFIVSLGVLLEISPSEVPFGRCSELLSMSIESLRLWIHLLASKNQIAHESFSLLMPIVIKQLQFCCTLDLTILPESSTIGVSFDAQYAASLITCASLVAASSPQCIELFTPLVESCLGRWLAQICGPGATHQALLSSDGEIAVTQCFRYFVIVGRFPAPLKSIKTDQLHWFANEHVHALIKHLKLFIGSNSIDSCDALPVMGAIRWRDSDQDVLINVIDENRCEGFLLNSFFSLLIHFSNQLRLIVSPSCLDDLKELSIHRRLSSIDQMDCIFLDPEMDALGLLLLLLYRTSGDSTESCFKSDLISIVPHIADEDIREILCKECVFNANFYCRTSSISSDSWKNVENLYKNHFTSSSWPLHPVWQYNQWISESSSLCLEKLSSFLLLIDSLIQTCPEYVNACLRFKLITSLGCAFLATNDAFFEPELEPLWKNIIKDTFQPHQKLSPDTVAFPSNSATKFADLMTFYDELINHFESVSYGSDIFATYIISFLRMECSSVFREKLYCEHATATKWIRIGPELHMYGVTFDANEFLQPIEMSAVLLNAYYNVLVHFIRSEQNPLLFLITTHHLHHALFSESSNKLNRELEHLKRSILNCKDDKLRDAIVLYSKAN